MNTHTPGPWEIVQMEHGIVVRTESPKKTKYNASRYAAIGGFDRSDPEQFAEALANARLIAAAPDLLGSLETILDCYNCQGTLLDEQIANACAAIAKAVGDVK